MTKASIIIPTFNRPEALRNCVRALLQQTYASDEFEILVVDDGSAHPIDAAELADQSGRTASNPQVRVIRQVNSGPAAARNLGAQEARGELLAFIDDDCLAEEGWLAELIETHQRHPDALVGGESINALHDNVFAVTNQIILDFVYEYFNLNPSDAVFLASNNWLCRREMYLQLGGFSTKFRMAGGEDRDFCFRWNAAGFPIVWQREARARHLHHQNLPKFLNMHMRYGRGAYHFHKVVAQSNFRRNEELRSFYRSLLWRVLQRLRGTPGWLRRGQITLLLLSWQVFNALGSMFEAMNNMTTARRNRKSDPETGHKTSGLPTLKWSGEGERFISPTNSEEIR